ncbi:MAG: hypothetical protein JO264_01285 [Acidisphaera sp.]|nr:hypothetical protein [Acidisphaera sp.]
MLASGQVVHFADTPREAATHITISGGRTPPLSGQLQRDPDVMAGAPLLAFRVVGEIEARTFILTDTYQSRPGGAGFCQAGQERFLRVLTAAARRLRETLRVKLESCRENVELVTDGVQWFPERRMVTVHWLSPPAGWAETQSFTVSPDGAVTK